MSSLQHILAIAIAAGIPIVFLVIIYTLDLYASRAFRLVVICFAWGGIGGLGLSFLFNTKVALPLIQQLGWNQLLLFVAFAPVAEEILKSLSIFYVSRRPEFTYFVDGAIYGFAAGIGFSITENFLYIQQNPRQGIPLALVRAFSTCLMHGTAAALVGAAVGRFRFRHGSSRGFASLSGWVAAILLHALFNSISRAGLVSDKLVTPLAVGLGLLGVGLIAYFISLGLKEQRQWLADTLDRKVGVTAAEMRAVQSYGSVNEILEPIFEQFPAKAEQVEALLLRQAQLGIKRKVQQKVSDPKMKATLNHDIDQLQLDMERLRKEIGPYVMVFVRSVFPDGALDVWGRLETLAVQSSPGDLQKWARLLSGSPEKAPTQNIFARLQAAQQDSPDQP